MVVAVVVVDVMSVVVAVRAAARPVLRRLITMRLIMSALTAENVMVRAFIDSDHE